MTELEHLLKNNPELKAFLKESPNEIRRINGRTIFHFCCNEKMIKIERYKLTNGIKRKLIETKMRGKLYYCLRCNDWYEIQI